MVGIETLAVSQQPLLLGEKYKLNNNQTTIKTEIILSNRNRIKYYHKQLRKKHIGTNLSEQDCRGRINKQRTETLANCSDHHRQTTCDGFKRSELGCRSNLSYVTQPYKVWNWDPMIEVEGSRELVGLLVPFQGTSNINLVQGQPLLDVDAMYEIKKESWL
eukprot:TRINITY_DN2323_c0_g1_i4.p2 TRINITY_DN2323_c0_g1~~TRINITY_DN2323_c0_g1_i4.p2  ORF type:complete len:161 (+),score=0.06 TRINITY_DN2323_c0_g1_i4:82-564(+)